MLKAEIVQVQRSFALPFRLSAFLFIPFCLRRGGTPSPYLASRIDEMPYCLINAFSEPRPLASVFQLFSSTFQLFSLSTFSSAFPGGVKKKDDAASATSSASSLPVETQLTRVPVTQVQEPAAT
jgi:hypothetical protein